jgi:hypothetical protein
MERILKREGYQNILMCMHILFKDSIMKPRKYCLKKQGGERKEWEYNGGGKFVQVHCMHVWNHQNETPSYH